MEKPQKGKKTVYCYCRAEADGRFMIMCNACKEWYHGECIDPPLAEDDTQYLVKYFCRECEPVHGKTIYKEPTRKSAREKSHINYNELNQGIVVEETRFTKLLKTKIFAPDQYPRIEGKDLTLEWTRRTGLRCPVVIESPDGLDMRMPDKSLVVNQVADMCGRDREVDVLEVATQSERIMTLDQWAKYFHQAPEKRKKILNVITLEIGQTPLGAQVQRPKLVNDLDWIDNIWPKALKAHGMYPRVQLYCLMSVKDSYTDFHIDFGGSSVFYHLLSGEKVFYFIEPTKANLKKYEKWSSSPEQGDVFLADEIKGGAVEVKLTAGNTMIIPTGWIHAVYTPADAVVIGGNYLHGLNMEGQLEIAGIEDRTHVPPKFRFPYFEHMQWYAARHYLRLLKRAPDMVSHYELDGIESLITYLHMKARQMTDISDVKKDVRKELRRGVPRGIKNVRKMLRNLARYLRLARNQLAGTIPDDKPRLGPIEEEADESDWLSDVTEMEYLDSEDDSDADDWLSSAGSEDGWNDDEDLQAFIPGGSKHKKKRKSNEGDEDDEQDDLRAEAKRRRQRRMKSENSDGTSRRKRKADSNQKSNDDFFFKKKCSKRRLPSDPPELATNGSSDPSCKLISGQVSANFQQNVARFAGVKNESPSVDLRTASDGTSTGGSAWGKEQLRTKLLERLILAEKEEARKTYPEGGSPTPNTSYVSYSAGDRKPSSQQVSGLSTPVPAIQTQPGAHLNSFSLRTTSSGDSGDTSFFATMPPWPQELAAALQHSLSNGSNSAAYVPSALGLGSVNQERSPACSVAPLASLAFTAPMDPMGSVMRSHALGAGVGGMASSAIASTVSMPLPPFTSSSDPFTSTQSLVSGTGTLAANLFRQLADSHITLASTTFPTNSSAGLVACPSTAATSTPSITVIPTTLVPISGTATASPIHTVAGTVLPQLTGMTSPTGMIAVPGLGVVPMSSIAHLFPAGYLQPMQTSSPPSRADDANLSNPMRPPQVKAQRKPKRRNDTVYDRLQKNLQRLGKGK